MQISSSRAGNFNFAYFKRPKSRFVAFKLDSKFGNKLSQNGSREMIEAYVMELMLNRHAYTYDEINSLLYPLPKHSVSPRCCTNMLFNTSIHSNFILLLMKNHFVSTDYSNLTHSLFAYATVSGRKQITSYLKKNMTDHQNPSHDLESICTFLGRRRNIGPALMEAFNENHFQSLFEAQLETIQDIHKYSTKISRKALFQSICEHFSKHHYHDIVKMFEEQYIDKPDIIIEHFGDHNPQEEDDEEKEKEEDLFDNASVFDTTMTFEPCDWQNFL